MNHLIIMRHGRSLLNDGYKSSEKNNVLAWRGVLGVMAEAEPLKSHDIHRVMSSPIPRAYQTAMLTVGAIGRGIEISLHPELEEIRPLNPDHDTIYEDDAAQKAWKSNIDIVPAWGSESQAMVYDRVSAFLAQDVFTELSRGSVILVSHYFTIRAMRSYIEHGTPAHMPEYRPYNGAPVLYSEATIARRLAGATERLHAEKR